MSQNVLITGGSQGIGAAAVRELFAHGWQVAIGYCASKAAAEALAAELTQPEQQAVALYGDVADSASAEKLVRNAEQALGTLDAVVCCAGEGHFGLLSDLTDEQWRRITGINLDGVFYALRAAIPGMVRRKSGAIVTVSSMWGVTGGACEVAYSAAKAGVIGLTRALAKELGPSGIRVNCVAPGVVETRMNAALDETAMAQLAQETPLGRIGQPEEIATCIRFLCGEEAAFMTGQVMQPNGGIVI